MTEETRKRMENARHNWRAFSTDDNGVCNEKPDDVFETGYTAAHNDAQGEIEKIKVELDELITDRQKWIADCKGYEELYKNKSAQVVRFSHALEQERAASAELIEALQDAVDSGYDQAGHCANAIAAHHARQKERG